MSWPQESEEEIAQQVKALPAIAEDPGSFTSTHFMWFATTGNSGSRGPDTLFQTLVGTYYAHIELKLLKTILKDESNSTLCKTPKLRVL